MEDSGLALAKEQEDTCFKLLVLRAYSRAQSTCERRWCLALTVNLPMCTRCWEDLLSKSSTVQVPCKYRELGCTVRLVNCVGYCLETARIKGTKERKIHTGNNHGQVCNTCLHTFLQYPWRSLGTKWGHDKINRMLHFILVVSQWYEQI